MRNPNFLDFKFIAKPKRRTINMKTQKTTHNKKRNSVWILTILMFSGLLGLAEMSLAAADPWIRKADMPTTRSALSTSVVNGMIYAITGGTAPGVVTSAVEAYDPVTDIWTKKADIPTGGVGLGTSVVNGIIYAIGGSGGLTSVEAYDPATDTWTKKADMPTGRVYFSTSAVNGRIYAIGGGTDPFNFTPLVEGIVEEYDTGFREKGVEPTGKLATMWGEIKR